MSRPHQFFWSRAFLLQQRVDALLTWISPDRENRVFVVALVFSLIFHCGMLAVFSYHNVKYNRQLQKNIEVIYQILEKKTAATEAEVQNYRVVKKEEWTPPLKSVAGKKGIAAPVAPTLDKSMEQPLWQKANLVQMGLPQKQSTRIPGAEQKRNVSIPLLDSEKINNPKYLSYHDRIRNKIRNRAYLYVDNPEFENGSVYLTFVVAANGEVTAVRLVEERTSANDYLRSAGLRSIKESSPFPPFPTDLPYPELTFNVIISFETGK